VPALRQLQDWAEEHTNEYAHHPHAQSSRALPASPRAPEPK
jgi:hypothetical protein